MAEDDTACIVSKIKIIFLGDPAVGKTSLISAIRNADFHHKHQTTIGIDFYSKIVQKGNRSYKLQFWDTAGQERFRSIIPAYVRNSNIGVIMYDVLNFKTFRSLDYWLESFRENAPQLAKIIILGNKVSEQEAEEKTSQLQLKYIETSAKTKQGIQQLLDQLVNVIEESHTQSENEPSRCKSYKGLNNCEQLMETSKQLGGKKCCYI